ncbi:MAG: TIGR02147 family protein [Fibrobacterales bacterium]|nr:TIGR02147 family protein [Fibrobacterales bacterium]
MARLTDYIDARKWLADECRQRQESRPGFSVRALLKKSGIASPSYLKQVIDGKRNLTAETTERLIAGFGLGKDDAEFFRELVGFTQAKSAATKKRHYERMLALAEGAQARLLGEGEYRFYEKPHLPALREALCARSWNGDWKAIARSLVPPITVAEAKAGAKLLERLGLVVRDGENWALAERNLTTGHEVDSLAVRGHNRRMMELGARALDELPRDRRHVSGVAFGVSAGTKKLIELEIEAFEDRVMRLIARDEGKRPDEVCQLLCALFPLAELPAGGTEGEGR